MPKYFRRLAKEERIVGLVVGLPVFPSGMKARNRAKSRVFAEWLAEVTGLPVTLFDERDTTAIAEELMLGADHLRPTERAARQARRTDSADGLS